MLITRIELENIKSYRQLAVDFRRGTTAISGSNGAGKTTLVEAIGYALFDFLPYSQAQFVREGEKYGHIIIHLIGGDDRPYVVSRRCGAGASWSIYDCEADSRLEQRADVQDKLHELFGIDPERSLKSLFRDALGVPQGSFTAIFLEAASERKLKFDALLQIEDYKNAADYLLDAQKEYKEQIQAQQNEIQRLVFETRDVETWRTSLKTEQQNFQDWTIQQFEKNRQKEQLEAHLIVLTTQRDTMLQLQNRFEQQQAASQAIQSQLQDRERELEKAREAHQLVEASRHDYQQYQRADETLKGLRKDAQQRDDLLKRQAEQRRTQTKVQTTISHLHGRLREVDTARRKIEELLPLVDEQIELEKQRDDLVRRVTEFDGLVKEGKSLVARQVENKQKQEALQQNIARIEPLQPVAALLQERVEAVANLQAQLKERGARKLQLEEKRGQLLQKQEEREKGAARLRQIESRITEIEAHRMEAQEVPVLQTRYTQITEQRHRLEGNIDGYTRSRQQSVGGQCPFLQEPCLNIKRHGVVSLESYFDGLLAEDHARLTEINTQQEEVSERIDFVKKYSLALDKLGQYVEQQTNAAEHLQRLAGEITRLERDTSDLEYDIEALKLVEHELNRAKAASTESQEASRQVNELAGWRMQVQHLQDQIETLETNIQELRQQAMELQGSGKQLEQVKQALKELNDPRGQTRAQHDIARQEPTYRQQLQAEQEQLDATEGLLHSLEQQLNVYADLDKRIGEQESLLQHSQKGHRTYLANEQAARLLPEREQAYQEMQAAAERAQQALQAAEQAYEQAKMAFNEAELSEVTQEIEELRTHLSHLIESIRTTQVKIGELEQQIQQAEVFLVELEAARKEKSTLEELLTMMEQFRKLMKEAVPYVLNAILSDISAEANRIFGEIMGDRSAQLSWQNEYEIILRRQGVNRTFAQLSGGEQMSAALSVRLALLKKLSTLNIAFFDEPTQNMDELRRTNLAEQIRRVRGFDQLIVISHDDTFEQGLDSILRLRKVDGTTHLMTAEDEVIYAT